MVVDPEAQGLSGSNTIAGQPNLAINERAPVICSTQSFRHVELETRTEDVCAVLLTCVP